MLRQRSYLREANVQRDMENRRIAEDFHKSLIEWLKLHSDKLERRPNGELYIDSSDCFWNHPKAKKLMVVFTPSGKNAGLGRLGGHDAMVLPYLIDRWDSKYLATRINHDAVIHEVIHLLDPGQGKREFTAARKLVDKVKYPKIGFHISPIENRDNIATRGIVPDPMYKAGTGYVWFFGSIEDALEFVDKEWGPMTGKLGNDIWEVDLSGLKIQKDPHPGFLGIVSWAFKGEIEPSRVKLVKTHSLWVRRSTK